MRAHLAGLAAAMAGAVCSLLAPAAGAATAQAPVFRDRVFPGAIARAASLRGASPETGYRAPDGQIVRVRVSNSVPNGPAVAQGIVNFLGGLTHGLELERLRVAIGTPAEIREACGGDPQVLACYSAGERRMYVPDRDPQAGNPAGFTRDYAVTHEYGHHIAAFRSNRPFLALNWGAKYWASYKFVCIGVDEGRYFPGNQGRHYLDDPGESFADTYAHLHYPDVRWQFNPGLTPDAGAYAAIRRDVLDPWRGPARKTLRGNLRRGRSARAISFTATLDGTVDLRLRGPRAANYDIVILNGRRVVDRTRSRGSNDRLRLTLCRDSSPTARALVRVIRRSGSGPFRLTVQYPG